MSDIILETKVINKFVSEQKRDRYIEFIQKINTRKKFLNDLSNKDIFDNNCFEPVSGKEEITIRNLAKTLGITDCYIVSENKNIDGKRINIEDALENAISPWSDTSTLIVFGDARVIYREHEGYNNRWISK